jgi:anti-sigma B factor antagonist
VSLPSCSDSALQVVVCDAAPEYLVAVAGELDLASAPELERTLYPLEQPGTEVTLDLRDLSFMDLAGLHALIGARLAATEAGSSLHILGPGAGAVRVLELTGTLDLVQ